MAQASPFRPFWRGDDGATAVEFALVLPVFILLTLGTIGACVTIYMNSALHFAVEDAARCASVNAACAGQTATAARAAASYKGPTISDLTFTLTPAATGTCGNQVTASGTFALNAGFVDFNVPVNAQACYPTG